MAERERRIAGLGALWALIREDLRHNGGISYPGFQAVALYRFGVWKDGIGPKALRVPFTLLYRLAYIFVRNVYGIELPHTARIGRRFAVGHQHGITVHGNSTIGDDCMIRQGVTLGQDRATRGCWSGTCRRRGSATGSRLAPAPCSSAASPSATGCGSGRTRW